ncbi:hypothetical protein [Engelhardtia mirabilis]|uniref:Uncharacterized protein n=1 Tax=Engelhardtia mirabilis TaxID=2528011 RepID=A0A518BGV1_9BACT|nr:hypothetical protein Pla133_12090 [Planctomycetes bacterium Pla133]QDV00470.1 hypothetical protein Pla86_12090 [Planctomycetes bacterium Pla86]
MRLASLALAAGSLLFAAALVAAEQPAPTDRAARPVVSLVDADAGTLVEIPGLGVGLLKTRVFPIAPASAETVALGIGAGPSNPSGENSLVEVGACCAFNPKPCPTAPGAYSGGDSIYLNAYWTETIPVNPGNEWIAGLTVGVKLPNGSTIALLDGFRFNFGDLSFAAGVELGFCAALQVDLPDITIPLGPIEQGFGISTIQGGFAPVTVNSFSIN